MGISFTDFTGGSSKSNDFAVNTGVSGNNVFTLDRTYDTGSYAITIASQDGSFDIYAVGTDGSYVGYTNSNEINISDKFNKLVILGLPNNDQVFFEYRGKVNVPLASGSVPAAGAYVSSVSVSSLEDIDDTTTITGGNFANDVEVYFVGQSNTETAAKNIVVTSVNQLIVTRPDSFDPNDSPYTIKVVNPGIPTPDGSNLFRLSNSVTAGTIPSWTTGSTVYYQLSASTSIDLVAADTEISDIDYSIVSGTLPSGLSLDTETGAISGTFSGSANDGDFTDITLRATDTGGNFVDKTISFIANAAPSWNTAAGGLSDASIGQSYSTSISATSGASNSSLTYSIISGSLPTGLSMNLSGSFSGTPGVLGTGTFTVRVEDEFGNFSDREFSIVVSGLPISVQYVVVAGGGGGGSILGGGGAGGYREGTLTEVTALDLLTITVGAGGASSAEYPTRGGQGNDSVFGPISASGGGGGAGEGPQSFSANAGMNGSAGGSGGGGAQYAGVGGAGNIGGYNPVEGYAGGGVSGYLQAYAGGAGGGAAGVGGVGTGSSGGNGGPGRQNPITGTYLAGGGGGSARTGAQYPPGAGGIGGGGTENEPGDPNTGGGGGGRNAETATGLNSSGGSGVVILKYPDTHTASFSGSVSYTTSPPSGGYKITTVTATSTDIETVAFLVL
jgi:hypothetical protein